MGPLNIVQHSETEAEIRFSVERKEVLGPRFLKPHSVFCNRSATGGCLSQHRHPSVRRMASNKRDPRSVWDTSRRASWMSHEEGLQGTSCTCFNLKDSVKMRTHTTHNHTKVFLKIVQKKRDGIWKSIFHVFLVFRHLPFILFILLSFHSQQHSHGQTCTRTKHPRNQFANEKKMEGNVRGMWKVCCGED